MTTASTLDTLKRGRPEWTPWLAVVTEIREQMDDPVWDATVPALPVARPPSVPLLDKASIGLGAELARRSFTRLIEKASTSGSAAMAPLARLLDREPDVLRLFAASVCHQSAVVTETAAGAGADGDALHAVNTLFGFPFLQACQRRWATSIQADWAASYCPICASRPAFVEVRGIERTRHARCSRCGAEWYARLLRCSYCDNSDHEQLLTLQPQGGTPTSVVEACTQCRGYVKTFTRLQGCAPHAVYLEDLASVDLDLAALEAGYARPDGAGYPLSVTVHEHTARRWPFGWRA